VTGNEVVAQFSEDGAKTAADKVADDGWTEPFGGDEPDLESGFVCRRENAEHQQFANVAAALLADAAEVRASGQPLLARQAHRRVREARRRDQSWWQWRR
jgi:hypothetical protein